MNTVLMLTRADGLLLSGATGYIRKSYAVKGARNESSFEKDGCAWVGWVGLKFSSDERLVHVSPGVSYGEPDPCFPR
jgi:hypothetical protein